MKAVYPLVPLLVAVAALTSVEQVAGAETCVASCNEIYAPVCGSDGKTYENQCTFDYKKCSTKNDTLTVVSTGECPSKPPSSECPKACPANFQPVCGSNGKTYGNECELKTAQCKDKTITLASQGECASSGSGSNGANADCPKECPKIFQPVCGSNGKTYGNECELKVAKCKDQTIALASQGECASAGSGSDTSPSAGSAGTGSSGADDSVGTPSSAVPTPTPTTGGAGIASMGAPVIVASLVAFMATLVL